MSRQLPEEWFVRDARVNAAISWVITVTLAGIAVAAFLVGLLEVLALAAVATSP
mgnify:CR=1 FL=1